MARRARRWLFFTAGAAVHGDGAQTQIQAGLRSAFDERVAD
jgi:hypothetical protein